MYGLCLSSQHMMGPLYLTYASARSCRNTVDSTVQYSIMYEQFYSCTVTAAGSCIFVYEKISIICRKPL